MSTESKIAIWVSFLCRDVSRELRRRANSLTRGEEEARQGQVNRPPAAEYTEAVRDGMRHFIVSVPKNADPPQ